nr:Chain A, Retro-KR-12 [synthetic construct]
RLFDKIRQVIRK